MKKNDVIDNALAEIDSDFVKALNEPARIEILKLLILRGSCDIKTLAENMPQDRSVISRHLTLMAKAGLVAQHKEGRHMIYSVDGKSALQKSEQLVQSIRMCIEFGCC